MRCIKCSSHDDKVIDSRASKDGCSIRRRRECLKCQHRFTTYEQLERNDLRVIKRNGVREHFERAKLLNSLTKACEKRPVSIDTLEQAAEEIMNKLQDGNLREIPSSAIGPLVMRALEGIDSVAFVRYASVYREFADVGEFIDEIEALERRPPPDEKLQPELFR